jgi:hypothetical protein
MTTQAPTQIKFNLDTFADLSLEEWIGDWNAVGFTDLSEAELNVFMSLFAYIGAPIDPETGENCDLDENDVLLLKTKNTVIDRVYGPNLHQHPTDPDQLVLKVGANYFTVVQEKQEFLLGGLTGSLNWGEIKKIKIKVDGADKEVSFQPCTISFIPTDPSAEDIEYVFDVRIDLEKEPTQAKVVKDLRKDGPLSHYLKKPSSGGGGGNAVKFKDLWIGEFAVRNIKELPENEWGVPFLIDMFDPNNEEHPEVVTAWAQGGVKRVLDSGRFTYEDGMPLTVAITAIRPEGDKTYVDCALRKRWPKGYDPNDLPFDIPF